MELNDGEFKKVEEIFQRCLPVAWSVDMFQFYLDYIRRMNNVLTGGEQARITITQAYEFVLSVVGIDKDSGRIWADYLEFIRSSQVHIIILNLTLGGREMERATENGPDPENIPKSHLSPPRKFRTSMAGLQCVRK